MSDSERESPLPKVEPTDLLALVGEEILDPSHVAWWKKFSKENPELAREVIKRAYFDSITISSSEESLTSMEVQKIIVDAVSFAMSALRVAALRRRGEAERALSTETRDAMPPSDDAGDADPQPSA